MHESFQFAAILITILAGILFSRNDTKELRADFRRMEDRLDRRIDRLDGEVKDMRSDLKGLREDYTEFYAEQRRHDEAIETLKKRQ